MEELKGRLTNRSQLTFYVSMKTIETIHRALDIPLSQTLNGLHGSAARGPVPDEDDEVEEQIGETI